MKHSPSRTRTGVPWWGRLAFGVAAVAVAIVTR